MILLKNQNKAHYLEGHISRKKPLFYKNKLEILN